MAWLPALLSLAWPIVKKILIQLGFALVTYTGVKEGLDFIFNNVSVTILSVDSHIFAILSLMGFGKALGIVFGALSAKAGLGVVKKLELR